ncbi:hypothetical protein ACHAWF_004685 [Thalassiosira exigua]
MAKVANGSSANGAAAKSAASNAERPQPSSSGGGLSLAALTCMALLALQFGVQPILTRRHTSKDVVRSTVVFAQEAVKLVIGVVGIKWGKRGWGEVTAGWTMASWFRLALLPATIYLVQNMCSLLAYQNLDAITYNVLNQTKTLSAAVCCYFLLGKRQSPVQILALLLLLAAALVMEKVVPLDALLPARWTGEKSAGERAGPDFFSTLSGRHLSHGVLPIMAASFLSGLAGAITQKSLQAGDRDALLFTVELCVASLLILLGSFVASDDGRKVRELGFFHGWTTWTLLPILTNAAGGILVGLVIKHAGTVRKGFALIFGILISGLVQSALDADKTLSREEVAGGVLAAISLWMHATNPYVARTKPIQAATKAAASAAEPSRGPVRRGRGRKED